MTCTDPARWTSAPGDLASPTIDRIDKGDPKGQPCIRLQWDPAHAGPGEVRYDPGGNFGGKGGVSFWLRAEGGYRDGRRLTFRSDADDGAFCLALDIALNFEGWIHVRLSKQDFACYRTGKSRMLDWTHFRTLRFILGAGENKPALFLGDIRFEPFPAGPRLSEQPVEEKFWWWREPVDRFAAMHLRHGHWPRLAGLGEQEPASVSDYLLCPGMPYTLHLRNLGNYSRWRVVLRDWDGNEVNTFDIPNREEDNQAFRQKLDIVPDPPRQLALRAPARCGTYVFDIACYDQAGHLADTYQTGVFVLAKILREPHGYWGLHTYQGTKAASSPHHRWVLDTLSAFGVKIVRERMAYPTPGVSGDLYTHQVRKFAELAREHDIRVIGLLRADNEQAFDLDAYDRHEAKPGLIRDAALVAKDAHDLAAAFRGLVDWWECFNEPNHFEIDNYAEILRIVYKGLKAGDPDCAVVMAGMDVHNNWPVRLIDKEEETGKPYSDALGTHLYPCGATLGAPKVERLYPIETHMEDILRQMIHSQDRHLPGKGMLMTEGGIPELDFRDAALVRERYFTRDYSAERMTQHWVARYGVILLGECMKAGAPLHGCCFFRCVASMGRWFDHDPEVRVNPTGFFTNHWDTRDVTFARPNAYALNTLARLLTHDVSPAEDIPLAWDKARGHVEQYAFERPGEIILCLWIGVHAGMRAAELAVELQIPDDVGLALVADNDGNESLLDAPGGRASLQLSRDTVSFVRLIKGTLDGKVFMCNVDGLMTSRVHLVEDPRPTPERRTLYQALVDTGIPASRNPARKGINIHIGTPTDCPRLLKGIAADRDLPVVGRDIPAPGHPLVLYSEFQRAVFIVGQSDRDLGHAVAGFRRRVGP